MERGGRAQLLKIKAQVSSIWAKGCILITVCVRYLTWQDYPSLEEGESRCKLGKKLLDENDVEFDKIIG